VPDLGVFRRLVARVKPLGWHIVLHLDADDISAQQDLLQRIDVPFIIDHMGASKRPTAWSSARFNCCSICTAATAGLGQSLRFGTCVDRQASFPRRRAVRAGSDRGGPGANPLGNGLAHPNISKDMPNDGELVDLFAEICPDPDVRRRILVDNPTRMYWTD